MTKDRIRAYRALQQGDTAEAASLMIEAAQNGDPEAQLCLAAWYKSGNYVPVDPARHKYWMDRLLVNAQSGSGEAQKVVSHNYRYGNMVPCDLDASFHWILEAAKNGDAEAQYEVHNYYSEGYGRFFKKDKEQSEYWLEKSVEQRFPEALCWYSRRFWHDGKPTEKAIELWKEAARQGDATAINYLNQWNIAL